MEEQDAMHRHDPFPHQEIALSAYYNWLGKSHAGTDSDNTDWTNWFSAEEEIRLRRHYHDFRGMKLGKQAPRYDPRTLELQDYLAAVPMPPASVDWSKGVEDFGELENDVLGCCTISAVGHAIQIWSLNASKEANITNQEVLGKYESWCGYNPANPASDQGGVILNVLNSWRKHNFAGFTLDAYASVGTPLQIQQAIWLFGAVDIGLELPISAQQQKVWEVVQGPEGSAGSWGGHSAVLVGYNTTGPICITWGILQQMTWTFYATYCNEAHALLSKVWLADNGQAASGFDFAQLQADLTALGSQPA